jgi:GNAT superfamily N-acetyltransferase
MGRSMAPLRSLPWPMAVGRCAAQGYPMQVQQGQHVLDDDLGRFDFGRCQAWLAGAYWSPGITRAEVERGFRCSTLVVGAYSAEGQDGCLRVVSDQTRFAYVMDVFVAEAQRGRGLGRALMRFALEHPMLSLVQSWMLATNDAHDVYRGLGFSELTDPGRWMRLRREREWL